MPDSSGGPKRGLSKQAIVLILIITVVICATAVVVAAMILGQPKEEPQPTPGLGSQVITAENYVAIDQEMQEKIAKGMFQTYMNTTWKFPDGKTASSNAVMGNSSANSYPFYFTVTLTDTSETVFTSGMLPVGTKMGEIKLEKELAKGTYPAVININMVDDDGQPVESNMGFNITLVVEK